MDGQQRFEHLACAAVWRTSLVVAFLLAAIGNALRATASPNRPPNIVIIFVDNLGKDWFGCYGSDEQATPNIDELAVNGVRFRHCYVTPLCSTTRVAFLTGRYGFRTGWHTHHDTAIYGGGYFDWEREITFARVLRAAGYATAITGKWQINDLYDQTDALNRHGFDEHLAWTGALVGDGTAERRWKNSLVNGRHFESRYWDPVVFRNGERLEFKDRFGPDLYVEFLIEFMRRYREQPFLAFYSTPMVHVPVTRTPHSPTGKTSERQQFGEMVRYVDYQVGQLVTALDRLGVRQNTIVMITTDNGTPSQLGGHVSERRIPGGLGKLTEPGLDVPLIVSWPAQISEGQVSDALVDCTDFFPTIVEVAGAELPRQTVLDGRSFAAELHGTRTDGLARDWIYSQYAATRLVRDRRFKLYSSGELFDVVDDALETKDLSSSDDPQVRLAQLRLQRVLDSLPVDAQSTFEPRSSSAFRLRQMILRSSDQVDKPADLLTFPLAPDSVRQFQQHWAQQNKLDVNIENSLHIQMVLIPPGKFLMGTSNNDVAQLVDESPKEQLVDVYFREVPQHQVTIIEPFYLSRTPVTVAQFRAFVKASDYVTEAERDGRGGFGMVGRSWQRDPKYVWNFGPDKAPADEEPVVNVSWNDAAAFCQWLTDKEGVRYRLPTEAEWEYACRAGTATSWNCGNDPAALASRAWYRENSNWTVHAVGKKEPNAFGLLDMHGNVRNWCADWYDEAYYVVAPAHNPRGPALGTHKVIRGGAFHYRPDLLRCATRFRDPPSHRHGQLGFRICRTVN